MASITHLRNAPITEAILDVRVRARRDLRGQEFEQLIPTLRSSFPEAQERRGFTATFELEVGRATAASGITEVGEVQGYFFISADRLDVAQFRVDGFTLNRLRPYQSWETWFPRFLELWQRYVDVARPEGVTQVGVRCINKIPIASLEFDLSRFLTAPPVVPPGLPLMAAGFVTTLALSQPRDSETRARLTQALQMDPNGRREILLDVDAFRAGEYEVSAVNDLFPPLHVLRNRLFFDSITDHTVRLHQ